MKFQVDSGCGKGPTKDTLEFLEKEHPGLASVPPCQASDHVGLDDLPVAHITDGPYFLPPFSHYLGRYIQLFGSIGRNRRQT